MDLPASPDDDAARLRHAGLGPWRGVAGKCIGGRIYVHRSAMPSVLAREVCAAIIALGERTMPQWTCARWHQRTGQIAVQDIPGFDTDLEPSVGDTVSMTGDRILRTPGAADPWIHHHRHLWVLPTYTGFDLASARRRSLRILACLQPGEAARIGRRSYWMTWLSRNAGINAAS